MQKSNKVLRVNLSTQETRSEKVPKKWLENFIGGKGLAVAYLYKEMAGGVEPFSPDNKLIFMLGPLTGFAPSSSRYCVATKSPHTGAFLHSYSGGDFPAFLKYSLPGHIGVIIEGKAENLVSLEIINGEVKLKSATDLKGEYVSEVDKSFGDLEVATIGPAGENLVTFATIATDNGEHHAGRGGAGAVMGSKNLKAIAVKGTKPSLPDNIQELYQEKMRELATGEGAEGFREGGTARLVDMINEVGTLPTRNWQKGSFDGVSKINLDAVKTHTSGRDTCYNCPIACRFILKTEEYEGIGPEFETLGLIGSNLEIRSLSGVAKIGNLCNELGMDTITTGNIVGLAMESAEKNLLDYEIEFGDVKHTMELVESIAYQEGVGEMLSQGTRKAGKLIGGEAIAMPAEVKSLEFPAYDPRGSYSMGLAYATSDRGACHQRSWAIGGDVFGDRDPYSSQEGHARAVVHEQDINSVVPDSLITCDFAGYGEEDAIKWLSSLGYKVDREKLTEVGERIWNLTRLFNIREGFKREDDYLPERMERPLEDGKAADGNILPKEDLQKMLDWYYAERGWDEEGKPLKETIDKLHLKNF